MTLLFISENNLWTLLLLGSICYSIFKFGPIAGRKMFQISPEKFMELGIEHHGHMFVVKDFSYDYERVFIERCVPDENQVYYAIAKGAHYTHNDGTGPCIKVNCMISQDSGFWTTNYFALKDLRPNSLFEVSFPPGGTLKIEKIEKDKAVFVDALER